METKKIGNRIIARLDKKEEVLDALHKIAVQYDIRLASVQAIGATNHVKIGLFNTEEKKYYSNVLDQDMEITSLIGNITRKDNEIYLHLHINVADENQRVYGGHLYECVISATLEMFIDVIDGSIERQFDENIGLNLMKF